MNKYFNKQYYTIKKNKIKKKFKSRLRSLAVDPFKVNSQ